VRRFQERKKILNSLGQANPVPGGFQGYTVPKKKKRSPSGKHQKPLREKTRQVRSRKVVKDEKDRGPALGKSRSIRKTKGGKGKSSIGHAQELESGKKRKGSAEGGGFQSGYNAKIPLSKK